MTQGPLIAAKYASVLSGAKINEHLALNVNLSRLPDGSIQANLSSPEDARDARGHVGISLSIDKNGEIDLKEYEITPPLEIRQQRENEAATQAQDTRVEQARTMARPFRALDDSPDGLFAQIRGRALALAPEARLDPRLWNIVNGNIGDRIEAMAKESAQPLTQEQILAIRENVLDEFFAKLGEVSAQVPAERRAVFTRGCLELGDVPDAALLPAMAQMADNVAGIFGDILDAKDGNEVRQLLSGLGLAMNSATTFNPDFAGKGGEFFATAHHLSMRMGILELMGKDNPQAFAQALTRPGPFRDALHSVATHTDEDNNRQILYEPLHWLQAGMTRILPDETLEGPLDPFETHERDLSLSRQREILGEGVYVARGAEIPRPELAALNQRLGQDLPELTGLNQSLSREMPAIREHIRASAETDLRRGPKGGRADSGLSGLFAGDYLRGGVFVDGRYYNPYDPQSPASRLGTGTSEQDFINLFPDARTAGLLSNLAAQNLPGYFQKAMLRAVSPETSERVLQNTLLNPDLVGSGNVQDNIRIETLNADQGRYRLSGFYCASSSNSESAVERFMYEVSVDVNLGPPGLDDTSRPEPSVEDVRVEFLLRGREAVPGEE
jgi:hypothetical protein